jgi:2-desacetyl-2-hydroxyethyl bacteriochlorophyllide A dehydrogenase
MKALMIHGPDRFAIDDVRTPEPRPDEVVIDVLATGICGTDLEILHGDMVYFTSGAAAYPVIPGHEWTGVVRAAGADIAGFSPGDHVVGEVSIGCLSCAVCRSGNYHRCAQRTETGILNRAGALAEQIALPAAFVHQISSSVPVRSAALVEPSAVAFNGVRRSGVSPCDQVAIFGDGPIGLLVLQIVRLFGVRRVVVIGAADKRLQLARELGADAVVDARTEDVVARLRECCGGELPNVVFEASGSPDAIRAAIDATAPGGRLVLQGFCGGRRVDGFSVDPLIVKDLTVVGALGSPGLWSDVIRMIENRRIDPSRIVSDELPLSAFSEAIRRVESREAIKVVLRADRAGHA